jgi:hypothetical protein
MKRATPLRKRALLDTNLADSGRLNRLGVVRIVREWAGSNRVTAGGTIMMKRFAVLGLLAAVTLASAPGSAGAADRNVRPYGPGARPAGLNRPVIVGATGVGVAARNWAFYGGEYPSYASPYYQGYLGTPYFAGYRGGGPYYGFNKTMEWGCGWLC